MPAWPHLHVHSYYTLLGATPAPEALAQRAAAEGLTHLALTDTHALYGAVAFDRACRAARVQPITGMTVNVAWPADLGDPASTTQGRGQLVLLAQNNAGYRSLCRLSSLLQGDPQRERRLAQGLTLEELHAHRTGLLCLTGGRAGWTAHHLRQGAYQPARRFLEALARSYGDALYLSLELHPGGDPQVADAVCDLGRTLGLPPVAVQPVYTLEPGDQARLRLLAAIDRNCTLDEVPPTALPGGGHPGIDLHWLSPAEMETRFANHPEALARAQEIAQRCAPALPSGTLVWPALDLPEAQTPEEALRRRAEAGARERYARPLAPKVQARLDHELATINRHGYAPLFLVVADIARFTRQEEIPMSTRGSVANSLVAYSLGITTVDPLAHELLFERFLSPGRADPPDIDLDFCSQRRDEVLAYVRRTYGEERVALVGAMNTLRWRSAVRETAKAYALDDEEVKQLLAGAPRRYHPRYRDDIPLETVLEAVRAPRLREVARAAAGITGFPHHLSLHAGGLVITPGPLTDLVPVQWTPKGFLCTQFDHEDDAAVGMPKLDLLGIRALTVLADAATAVRRHHRSDFRLSAIPLDDAETGDLLARGDTVGVFQCDSMGARRTLRQLRAHTVGDLAVANAFFKPGPATGGQADVFVRRYRGEAPVAYQHPALEPILASTKGVLIFQEQVLRVATEIAGLSWAQAGHIRRGMSKMDPTEMAHLQRAFIAGCQRLEGPGLTVREAEALWEQVAAFSGYGFNRGHATAYADVSYRTAYLKAHYPAALFWARLRNWGGYHHPALYMAEALRLGIDVRPPHVNHSAARVTLSWEEGRPVLYLGLGQVRDLRRRAVAALVAAREEAGAFRELRDLLVRVPLQAKEILHLIRCGALDGLGAHRPALLAEADWVQAAGSARQLAFAFGAPIPEEASPAQRLAWERHLLGYPLGVLRAWLPRLQQEHPKCRPLTILPETRGHVETLGVRLPGWHRGGFGLWDGASWVWAEPQGLHKRPASWEPTLFEGYWRSDRWGGGWFVVTGWRNVNAIGS